MHKKKKKKKGAVQISSSSFLGKEHEMSNAGVHRKDSLSPRGWWRTIYSKEVVGSFSERKADGRCKKNIKAVVRIFKLSIFGELHVCSKTKASNVSHWDWWKTSKFWHWTLQKIASDNPDGRLIWQEFSATPGRHRVTGSSHPKGMKEKLHIAGHTIMVGIVTVLFKLWQAFSLLPL